MTSEQAVRIFDAESIRRAVGLHDLIEPVSQAFADFSRGNGQAPIVVFAPRGDEGDVHVKCAWLAGRSIFTIKVAASFAARRVGGRSSSSGFIAAHDSSTGDLIALLRDEHHLTDVRTAAAGAVATRLLARKDASTLTVLGTSTQAYLQVLAGAAVRPIDTVLIWGRSQDAARNLQAAIRAEAPRLAVAVIDRAYDAVERADVIVTATSSRHPVLDGNWLRPGQHVTAVGADDPTKAELDPLCFARADVLVVDSRRDTPAFAGDLHQAIACSAINDVDIDAELADVITGRHPGRSRDAQITVSKHIGLGVQDLAAAQIAVELLTTRPTVRDRRPPASGHDLATARRARGGDW